MSMVPVALLSWELVEVKVSLEHSRKKVTQLLLVRKPRGCRRKMNLASGPNKVKEDKFMDGFNVAAASC